MVMRADQLIISTSIISMSATMATFTLKDLETYEIRADAAQTYIHKACSYLEQHKALHCASVIEFLSLNLGDLLPNAWYNALEDLTHSQLIELVFNPSECDTSSFPADLSDMLAEGAALRSDRNPVSMPEASLEFPLALHQLKGFNPKKIHESTRLVQLISTVAAAQQCNTVVDVGAGSCYIGQLLRVVDPTLRYVGIEGNEKIHSGAERRDQRLQKGKGKPDQLPTHRFTVVHARLELAQLEHNTAVLDRAVRAADSPTSTSNSGIDNIDSADKCNGGSYSSGSTPLSCQVDASQDCNDSDKVISLKALPRGLIAGLHACGDLTCSMLEAFMASSTSQAFVGVGCCYHAVSLRQGCTDDWFRNRMQMAGGRTCPTAARQPSPVPYGVDDAANMYRHQPAFDATEPLFHHFPMSKTLQEHLTAHKQWPLIDPFSMRRAAGSNVAKNRQAAEDDRVRAVRASYFRAVLEDWLLRNQDIELSNARTRLRKAQHGNVFCEYLDAVLEEATARNVASSDEVAICTIKQRLLEHEQCLSHHEKRLGIFVTLQMALECVVEDLVLTDRCLFLLENGASRVFKIPLFASELSPRCFALVAFK
eukprot:TRINITY_DN12590_c0_g1_i11.p1 TRINITY_DN12590_c0_g1~~TRINITY_DN12590_c0_g1_i11.p1  ORF type:complete len:595 (+),score=84.74 TRINITY_DN12590_c0_g1_i11:2644-4428(+)